MAKTPTEIYMGVLDLDMQFAMNGNNKSVVCDEQISPNQAKQYLKDLFMEGSSELNFVASCDEGCTTGNFYVGSTCPKCKTKVRTNFADELKYRAWLDIPDFMPPVIHPAIYDVLKQWMGSYKRASILDALLTIGSTLPPEVEGVMGQGFTYFHENFDDIIHFFLNNYKPLQVGLGKKRSVDIPKFLEENKNKIFVRHLPVLNNSLHMLTQSGAFKFSDVSSNHIIKALVELSDLTYGYLNRPKSPTYLDTQLKIMYDSYIAYTDSIIHDKLARKEGFIRKYMLGCRYHNSFRGVIVPITIPHMGDELHVPWRIGVAGLKLEILNLLKQRFGYTLNQALALHHKALNNFVKDVDRCLKVLIRECPYKGLPVIFNRNPSLKHGAIQLLYTTIIKPDINDDSIAMSPLVINSPNADFDGDALNGLFIKEMASVKYFINLHPKTTMLTDSNLAISNEVRLTKQSNIILNSWLKG